MYSYGRLAFIIEDFHCILLAFALVADLPHKAFYVTYSEVKVAY